MQNDPVNFVDPTGLLPSDGQCQGAECPWSGGGGGFWGGGFDLNDRRSLLNPSGREIIRAAEPRGFRYWFNEREELLEVTRESSAFDFDLFWGGFISQTQGGHPTRTQEQKRIDHSNCMNQAAAEYRQRAADEHRANRDFIIGYNTQTGNPSGAAATIGVGLFNKLRKLSFRVGSGITVGGRYAISLAHTFGHEIGNFWVGLRGAVAECERKARLP